LPTARRAGFCFRHQRLGADRGGARQLRSSRPARLERAARRHEKDFSWDKAALQYAALYDRLRSRGRR
jgi:glycogen synthase